MSISSKKITLAWPELGLIAITRAALGIGIGLLISDSLEKGRGGQRDLPLPRSACSRPDRFLLRVLDQLK